jgi:ParB/RepB/Spo0J family partition protein
MSLYPENTRRVDRRVKPTKSGADQLHGRQHSAELRHGLISIEKIFVPKTRASLDDEIVAGIAESMRVSGQLHPIAVRRTTKKRGQANTVERIVLVAGAHRLAAAKLLRRKRIICVYVEGDELHAKLVRLAENLWRKNLTVLRRAENLVEYVKIASANVKVSGQVDQKRRGGRPPSGKALAARELPLLGRSADAIRKSIERAEKIDRISQDAKKAAKKVGLADNQKALLRIAEAGGRSAQLGMVAELGEVSKKLNAPSHVAGAEVSEQTVKRTSAAWSKAKARSQRVTTCDEMNALCNRDWRLAWANFPRRERKKFVAGLLRKKCKVRTDIVAFLHNVFLGREKIGKLSLLGFASENGLSKKSINDALRSLGYRQKRRGHGAGSQWFVYNKDRNWKGEVKVVADADLWTAGDAQLQAYHSTCSKGRTAVGSDSYFEDIG